MIKFEFKLSRLHRTVALAAALALGVGMVLVVFYGRKDNAVQETGQWESVASQSQVNELASSGKLLPVRMMEISSPAAGVIAELAVTWGDTVVQGQHLGRADSPELVAQLRTAQAGLLRSRLQDGAVLAGEEPADVLNAKRRLLSSQTALKTAQTRQLESAALFAKGFVSRNEDEATKVDVQNAEQQVALSQEELKAAARKFAPDQIQALKLETDNKQAELAQLRERQKQLILTSPLTGVVLYPQSQEARSDRPAREIVLGTRVTAAEPIMAIGDTTSFLIRAYCTEAEFAWLEAGADAEVTLAALPEQTFTAKVTKVIGQAGAYKSGAGNGASYEFLVAFPMAGQPLTEPQRRKLRVGGTANLKVTQNSGAKQTSLPVAAVLWGSNGAAQVRWRASASQSPALKPIRILRSDVANVQVRGVLTGEVWVPGHPASGASEASGLKRMFGLDE